MWNVETSDRNCNVYNGFELQFTGIKSAIYQHRARVALLSLHLDPGGAEAIALAVETKEHSAGAYPQSRIPLRFLSDQELA